MKTTVKTWPPGTSLIVEPMPLKGPYEPYITLMVQRKTDEGTVTFPGVALTPDQAGALIFGMEQALEAGEVAQQRAAQA